MGTRPLHLEDPGTMIKIGDRVVYRDDVYCDDIGTVEKLDAGGAYVQFDSGAYRWLWPANECLRRVYEAQDPESDPNHSWQDAPEYDRNDDE